METRIGALQPSGRLLMDHGPRARWRVRALGTALVLTVIAGGDLGAAEGGRIQTVSPVMVGGRVDWHPSGSIVAIDRLNDADGRSDVYLMRPNGADLRCLTCTVAGLAGHNGNPAWHPSGYVVVFQAQNTGLPLLPVEWEPIASLATSPGWGVNHNLWVAMADGSRFWQLTNVTAGQAVLHPHFDATGTRLVWAEKIALPGTGPEQWVMKIGAFRWVAGEPQLSNVRTVAPFGTDLFYEAHEFSPDGLQLLFSAGHPHESSLDIYLLDLMTGVARNLTNSPGDFDEHAHFAPGGTHIVFASSRDISIARGYFVPYLDYWRIGLDGTGRERITYFNQPGEREYYANGIVAGDFSFGPDGWMLSKLEVGGIDPDIRVVELITALR